MNDVSSESPSARYAKCIEVSRRIRWDIDRDVIRGRQLDPVHKFLPDGLAQVDRLPFLTPAQRLLMSQVQGRTYANMFRLVERFVSAKMLEVSRNHALGDQTALEAVVRFTDEELKHQELFRRIELLAADSMLPGYRFMPKADEVASFVLGKSTWSVLALTCCIEIVTQVHYRESMELDSGLSPLFKDVFLFHWKEESQHAIIDELEWEREDAQLTDARRDAAIDDLIELVNAVDGLLQVQAAADAGYFLVHAGGTMSVGERHAVSAALLDAYRWQYIVSGVTQPRFSKLLYRMITPAQAEHIGDALAPIMQRTSNIDA
ncbi:hypothetical protein [Paraburkholderia sp. RL17-337-BIB-A]|uniref:hypothetical protein n=1 Tax=Paraburkholderia sp. RL17-337-BIB-A TaxID=3031636 RepID=UPI0038BC6893